MGKYIMNKYRLSLLCALPILIFGLITITPLQKTIAIARAPSQSTAAV